MPNIIDYIDWRGDLTFDVAPLNEVDNLIFSKLCYLDFSSIVNNDENNTLGELAERYIEEKGMSKIGMLLNENFPKLLEAVGNSKRFSSILVSDIVDNTDTDQVIQFAAMTFNLPNQQKYVAYRGTDDSIVGWKEDFLMSILDTVPAQEEALKYLIRINQKYPKCRVFIGGHSKGGNLAVYSAVNAPDYLRNMIVQVFNNDGPGFKESIITTQRYSLLAKKINTLVPKSSIVGMLLEHDESYSVVKCSVKQSGLIQHDGFTWEVLGTHFVHLQDVDRESKVISKTLKNVLNELTIEQRIHFTEAFFDILSANDQKTLLDIERGQWASLMAMTKAYDNLDKETRKALKDVIGAIFGEGLKQMFSSDIKISITGFQK